METIVVRLPTHYATYLFYGEVGDLTEAELSQLYDALTNYIDNIDLNVVTPIGFVEYGFANWHDGRWTGMLSADCSDYVFPINI